MQIQILQGDCIDSLKKLEDQSINTCITSPPYWGLRDYNGEEKQLGLEDTPEEFVENLVKVFREVKRVLRDDGTVWLNLGDSYAGNNLRASNNGRAGYGAAREGVFTKTGKGLKAKDLVGIPWRVALALQQDGWYLRQDIIWHKPNPMPESVKDRCTKAHEYIFLLSKQAKYYFDNEAIKEDCVTKNEQTIKKNTHGKYKTKENEAKNRQGIHANRGDKLIEVRTKLPSQKDLVNFLRSKTAAKTLANSTDIPLTKIEHWFRYDKTGFAYPTIEDWNKVKEFIDDWSDKFNLIDESLTYYELKTDEVTHTNKKNKRSVWTVSTKSFKGAHFATFPMDLIEPCVLAGCPEGGIVLDPFAGSGTTGIVAINNKRNSCLIDLNYDYLDIAENRIKEQAKVGYKIKKGK
jgi:site-specific DNA-methyltransferase (adenine-specific)